jgi:hypothetical protein
MNNVGDVSPLRLSMKLTSIFAGSLLLLATSLLAQRPVLVLNDPAYPKFNASALDQPVLDVYLTDPANGNQVFMAYNDWEERDYPVIFKAFVDTGASGFVISHLLATGLYDVPSLNLSQDDYIGSYTEIGIGGTEEGKVSRPLGVHVLNGQRYAGHEDNLDEFVSYGDFNLWVRQQEGMGEKIEIWGFVLANPINIVGMPVIRQGIMIMDPTGMQGDEPEYLATYIVPPGSPLPPHNITLPLYLNDFVGDTPPEGEVFPSHTSNPMIPGVTVTHTAPGAGASSSTSGNWLFDTGASSSFLAFGHAQEIGLIPAHYETLDAFVADHEQNGGKVAVVGGIGTSSVKVPIVNAHEIRISAKEGFDIAWQNVDLLIKDIPELTELGLDGIFGMNLIMPSVTMDSNDPGNLDPLFDVSPGVFRTIIFDPSDPQNPELRLDTFRLATSFAGWRHSHFDPEELNLPDISGPDADPDGDGLENLLEYAFGGHPQRPSRAYAPTSGVREISGQLYPTISYTRIKAAPDLAFHIERSTDLVTWSPADTEPVEIIDLGNREAVTVRASQPVTARSGFMRVRVELLEE